MRYLSILLFVILLSSSPVLCNDDQRSEVNESWSRMQHQVRDGFAQTIKRSEKLYQDVKNSWEISNAKILDRWDEMISSTNKKWVAYSGDLDIRSEIDFEKGYFRISAVIPSSSRDIRSLPDDRIKAQLKRLLSSNRLADRNVLENQIRDKKGRQVCAGSVDRFYDEEIKPQMRTYSTPTRSKGTFASATVQLVPDHIDVRARAYRGIVREMADKYNIEPELIMAIIHTESFFNPLAISSKGARGLMQLIPDKGGKEAYDFAFQTGRPIPDNALFNPETNIELGTAYLHLLQTNYFGAVKDPQKNMYLTICSYNWGPSAVNRNILQTVDPNTLSSEELYSILSARTPLETRNYLLKVTERMELYKTYF